VRRGILIAFLFVGCHDKYKEMQEQAAASASAAAAASASALAHALASASAAPAVTKPPERISVQYLLVAFKGADKAPKRVSRTKEQARLRAEEARQKSLAGGMDFSDIVQLYSDDPSGQERQGILHDIGRGDVVKEFADAAFALKENETSAVVESQFGFYLIKRNQ
jgi:hypothetical protein